VIIARAQTPEALAALVKADAEKWWPVLKEFGIKASHEHARLAPPRAYSYPRALDPRDERFLFSAPGPLPPKACSPPCPQLAKADIATSLDHRDALFTVGIGWTATAWNASKTMTSPSRVAMTGDDDRNGMFRRPAAPKAQSVVDLAIKNCQLQMDGTSLACIDVSYISFNDNSRSIQFNKKSDNELAVAFFGKNTEANTVSIDAVLTQNGDHSDEAKAQGQCILGNKSWVSGAHL
jgi:hypothetical protein